MLGTWWNRNWSRRAWNMQELPCPGVTGWLGETSKLTSLSLTVARLEPSESRSFRTGGQARPRCWYTSSVVAFGESGWELLSAWSWTPPVSTILRLLWLRCAARSSPSPPPPSTLPPFSLRLAPLNRKFRYYIHFKFEKPWWSEESLPTGVWSGPSPLSSWLTSSLAPLVLNVGK